jgi:hypothetical protein
VLLRGDLVGESLVFGSREMPLRAINIPKMRRHSSAVVAFVSRRCMSRISGSAIIGAGLTTTVAGGGIAALMGEPQAC